LASKKLTNNSWLTTIRMGQGYMPTLTPKGSIQHSGTQNSPTT
jgi:hypothetical protein